MSTSRAPIAAIERFDPAQLDAVVAFSLRAWAPVSRSTYEAAGFQQLPVARYFKAL